MAEPLAIILAGGANRRFWPLAQKSLLRFGDRTLLDRRLDELARAGFRDAILVGNPDNEARLNEIADVTEHIRVHVVVQPTPLGMGDAVLRCAPLLEGELAGRPAMVNQVHDVVEPALFGRLVDALRGDADGYVVGVRLERYFPGGYLVVDGDRARDVIEKPPPGSEPSDLMKIVADLVRDPIALLDALRSVEPNPSDQYERALGRLMAERRVHVVGYEGPWVPVKYPWDVLAVTDLILRWLPDEILTRHPEAAAVRDGVIGGKGATIDPRATIVGPVVVGEGVRISGGATIEGPAVIGDRTTVRDGAVIRRSIVGRDCAVNPSAAIDRTILGFESVVGNGALIRESVIGAHSVVGFASEVARSFVGDVCWFHTNYVGDSVIGDDVSFGSGTTTANLRLDDRTVRVTVDEQRVDTGRQKLGAMIGSHVRVGVNASLMPGVRIGSNAVVGPAVLLSRDLADNKMITARQDQDVRDNQLTIDGTSRLAFFGALRSRVGGAG